MATLRLTQTALGEDNYRVQLSLSGDGPAQEATVDFAFALTPEDRESMRWYLEDFLQYPVDPNPAIASAAEKRMAEIGVDLFGKVFPKENGNAQRIWYEIDSCLADVRIEITSGVQEAASIPWELMRDPGTGDPLALTAQAFIRTANETAIRPKIPEVSEGAIRILLVICRPGKQDDVPFRSVAAQLIRGLKEFGREAFQLDVLRPPTFEMLELTLHTAWASEKPYHVVHFDGHGAFLNMAEIFENWEEPDEDNVDDALAALLDLADCDRYSPQAVYPRPKKEWRKGNRGYLAFDNPESKLNLRLVDGQELGKVLHDTDVGVLVLNACRSAHAETLDTEEGGTKTQGSSMHDKVHAYGSLAQEVLDCGVAGCIAMRYNVYVVTAAQFVADFYAALAAGHALGEAATRARKQLHVKPMRKIAYKERPLQDWCVPIVHEAASIALFPKPGADKELHIELGKDAAHTGEGIAGKTPPPPDAGFFGRDETIFALDRAFDDHSVVLLHAFAGSGKTATVMEFAKWYYDTGGVAEVLFTSFEYHTTLERALDVIGEVFGARLEQKGIHWGAMDEKEARIDLAMRIFNEIPVLWIWDNVEPVTGFPTGTESAWTKEEQDELVEFLRKAGQTKSKFLLTSRRDEQAWLDMLPRRIAMPPMPMAERVELAAALAKKHGRIIDDVGDWRPLLRYAEGNPLTITVLVGQALRKKLATRDEITTFVEGLRSGEEAFDDDKSQGRTRSLAASLDYGFKDAFSDKEHEILALLHLFQGFVQVEALRLMGAPGADWALPQLKGFTHDTGNALLDRAAEVGLLTAHGGGNYSIHPALPWFFSNLFHSHYAAVGTAPEIADGGDAPTSPHRAFVEAMGKLGNHYHDEYGAGNRQVIDALTAEEANLLHARRLARQNGWWGGIIGAMQGLDQLYDHTGRRAEWKRLVEEIVPDFADPETGGPLPGRDGDDWGMVTQYRVLLAKETRDWEGVEDLQKKLVDWSRNSAAPLLKRPVDELTGPERNTIRSLSVALQQLGHIQRERAEAACVTSYKESMELAERIDDQQCTAVCAFNLGHAYIELPVLCDLDEAETWYERSLKLRQKSDGISRGICTGQLGAIALERFGEARNAKRPEEELLRHLNTSLARYNEALKLFPKNAVHQLAVTHGQLASVYGQAGDLDAALPHYNQSIHYEEQQGNLFGAATKRFNAAVALARGGRFRDALLFAQAALRNYETYGQRAAAEIEETQGFIAQIEQALQAAGQGE